MDLFFALSKIFTLLIFPLPIIILIGIFISLFIVRSFRNKLLSIIPVLCLWFFSSYPASQFFISNLEEEFPPINIDSLPKVDAIVVLGGMINPISKYNKPELLSSADRLIDTVILFKNKKAEIVIFSGGSGIFLQQDKKEAFFAKEILINLGIPESKILLESESRNTIENALYTTKILKEKQAQKIILVTSAFHMKRASMSFEKQNLKVYPFPCDYRTLREDLNWDTLVPSVGALETSTIAIKEWIGLMVYSLSGYL
jgi:uncharacterized SAM-binding protein YcdF (DUF218 family)